MTSLCTTLHTPSLLPKPTLHFSLLKPHFSLYSKPLCTTPTPTRRRICLVASVSSSSSAEIDMAPNKHGIYTPKRNKVVVLWDLDNKPPRGPPYEAAMALKQVAQRFGEVMEISAYANRHAFIHLPQWVREERRERKEMDVLERKGIAKPTEPYVCGVCGRKCKTNLELKKHFKQLHERERQKKLNRMRSLKGKKRQRFKERFISGNQKYNDEARRLLTPKVGYGLAAELRKAGVFVKTVEDKPQAADWAVKRQIEHSMSSGVDWLVLVSDDSDFSDILRRAREAKLGTVVVGDRDRALGRKADLWVPWIGVENGEITESDLIPKRRRNEDDDDESFETNEGFFSISSFEEDEVNELDNFVDNIIGFRSGSYTFKASAFSEGEEDEEEEEEEHQGYMVGDSDDEIEEEDEVFIF